MEDNRPTESSILLSLHESKYVNFLDMVKRQIFIYHDLRHLLFVELSIYFFTCPILNGVHKDVIRMLLDLDDINNFIGVVSFESFSNVNFFLAILT